MAAEPDWWPMAKAVIQALGLTKSHYGDGWCSTGFPGLLVTWEPPTILVASQTELSRSTGQGWPSIQAEIRIPMDREDLTIGYCYWLIVRFCRGCHEIMP